MTLREQIEEQNRQWRLFHEWEGAQSLVERSSEVRADTDPKILGIAKMHAALALLSRRDPEV